MRRQREKERLASEAYIRKLQEEEEQKKMLQLAQDQLYAKTLEKQEIENAKYDRRVRSTRFKLNNQSKPKASNKTPAKTKISADKKRNAAHVSKAKYERYASSNSKYCSTSVDKESPEIVASPKPVPIHNAVTRVVTHQSRSSQPNNSTCTAPDELIGSSSKIYGQQSEEELHVPSDVLSNKKKKLGVEVCMTVNVEDEERIGSAESAGSHDSMNQEFHHFKPIKALPRTPFRTLDGKQIEPKLIKVLPMLKRMSNIVPKAPIPTITKKVFGCSWGAFKRITGHQVLPRDSLSQQQLETKKTEQHKMEQSSKILQKSEINSNTDSSSMVSFDSNKNYTKNLDNKVVNGTKLNKNEQPAENAKQKNKRGKVRNGLIPSAFKKKEHRTPQKEIEVVQLEDDNENENVDVDATDGSNRQQTPDPLGPSPNKFGSQSRPPSYLLEFAAIENIAERIKRRKAAGTTDTTQRTVDTKKPVERIMKAKNKKPSAKGRKPKAKKQEVAPAKSTKTKSKTTVETTVASQIKRLARAKKSLKRPRYTEDSESEEEDFAVKQRTPEPVPQPVNDIKQKQEEPVKAPEAENPSVKVSSPSPRKRPRKNAHPSKKQKPTVLTSSPELSINLENESLIKERERLEQLAEQERKDRELAEQLQARFSAMRGVAGRTGRGTARLPEPSGPLPSDIIDESKRPPQKKSLVK